MSGDDTYTRFLSPADGLPFLWPRPPRWPTDAAFFAELSQEVPRVQRFPPFLLQQGRQQRARDTRWRHLRALQKTMDQERLASWEHWADEVLKPTGWSTARVSAAFRPGEQVTVGDFTRRYTQAGCLQLAHDFVPPAPRSWPCGECGEPCTSECICGEIYCSRACLRKAWRQGGGGTKGHRRVCETVIDQDSGLAAMVTALEMQHMLTPTEYAKATGTRVVGGGGGAGEGRRNRERAAAKAREAALLEEAAASNDPTVRNFARMRQSSRDVCKPAPGVATTADTDEAFRRVRSRSPIYRRALENWTRVSCYEDPGVLATMPPGTGAERFACGTADECVAALTRCLIDDSTAMAMPVDRATGRPDKAMPRLFQALRSCARTAEQTPSRPAADALFALATLDMATGRLDQSLETIERVLRNNRLRAQLTCEAAAVFTRSCVRVMRGDARGALADCREAIRMAEAEAEQGGDPGLAWSFRNAAGKCLVGLRRMDEAVDMFESFVDECDRALAAHRADGGGGAGVDAAEAAAGAAHYDPDQEPVPSGPLGGRELDPYQLAKVVEAEYSAAAHLLSEGCDCLLKGMMRRGRARYVSAATREATLPSQVLDSIDNMSKVLCQTLLASGKIPLTTRTQEAIQQADIAMGGSGAKVLECSACASTAHGGLMLCAGCKTVAYCGRECQRRHWKIVHKWECKRLRKEQPPQQQTTTATTTKKKKKKKKAKKKKPPASQ